MKVVPAYVRSLKGEHGVRELLVVCSENGHGSHGLVAQIRALAGTHGRVSADKEFGGLLVLAAMRTSKGGGSKGKSRDEDCELHLE